MGLFGNIVDGIIEGGQRAVDAKREGLYMDADMLAAKLNSGLSRAERMGYMSAAKQRGDIYKDSSGRFRPRY